MFINKTEGFSLIEIIVTTVIISGMVIAVTNLFITIDATQRRTKHLEVASRAAESKIESLRNSHYNSLTPGTTLDFTNELPGELPEPRNATVTISEPVEDMRRLEVSITYQEGNGSKEVKLAALIGSIGLAQ